MFPKVVMQSTTKTVISRNLLNTLLQNSVHLFHSEREQTSEGSLVADDLAVSLLVSVLFCFVASLL